MSLDVYCAERPRRTQVLAGSAADAFFGVNGRYLQCRSPVFSIIFHIPVPVSVPLPYRDHYYGSGGAVSGAVAAFYIVRNDNAVFPYPDCMAYLDGGLLCCRYRQNRACRTDFRAFGAFRPAVSSFVRHFRLHQSQQPSGWAQHIVRADRYAQLAGRAVLIEMFQADGSRRDDCRLPFRNLLVGDDGKPAIRAVAERKFLLPLAVSEPGFPPVSVAAAGV